MFREEEKRFRKIHIYLFLFIRFKVDYCAIEYIQSHTTTTTNSPSNWEMRMKRINKIRKVFFWLKQKMLHKNWMHTTPIYYKISNVFANFWSFSTATKEKNKEKKTWKEKLIEFSINRLRIIDFKSQINQQFQS